MTILLFLVCLICLIAGLIKPTKIIFWKQQEYRTKKNVLKYFGVATIVFFILAGVFNSNNSTKTNTSVVSNKTETVENTQPQKQAEIETEQPKEIKKSGWIQEKGNSYYYDSDGKVKTGWLKDNNKYYYLNASGIMQKDWIKDNGKDYYCDSSGVMQTGWKESNGKWYYLNSDGAMASNTTVDGYNLASNGVMEEKSTSTQSSTSQQNEANKSKDSSSNSNAAGAEKGQTAYITPTGKKYHRIPKCGNTKSSSPTTVEKAEQEGYGRCSKCW